MSDLRWQLQGWTIINEATRLPRQVESTALSFSLSSSFLASSYGLLICNISFRIKITNEYLIQLASNSSDKCSLLTWVCLLFVRVEVFRIGDGEHVVRGVRRRPSLCSRDGKHRLQPFKWEKVQSFVFWVLEEKQQKSLTGCIINFTIKCKSSTIFQETGTYESCLFLDLSSNPASSLNPAPATTPGQRQPLTPVCGAVLLSNFLRCNHCLRHPATTFCSSAFSDSEDGLSHWLNAYLNHFDVLETIATLL